MMTRRLFRRLRKARPLMLTYADYCLLYSIGAVKNHDELLAGLPKPRQMFGRYLPDDLNSMKMGTLVEIMECRDEMKLLCTIYNVTRSEIMTSEARSVIGLIRWTSEQIKSITALFGALEREYTAEELMAGAETMKGDIFTTIDWYARRMGITNHDDVLRVPWITIWRCARDDGQKEEYKHRLNQIHNRR